MSQRLTFEQQSLPSYCTNYTTHYSRAPNKQMEYLTFLLVMNFMVIYLYTLWTMLILIFSPVYLLIGHPLAFQFKPFGILLSIVSVRTFFSETTMSIDNKMSNGLSLSTILNFCQAIARPGRNQSCAIHSSSQQRLDQQFYALILNFEIPQIAYFQILIISLLKNSSFL